MTRSDRLQNQRPKVSVCVPVYNYGSYIADCIESVLAQTFADWEIVICDDQSTDDTRQICERYASYERRIRYFLNEHRLGMYGNFVEAVRRSSGFFVKPLCADDWLHPEYLSTCLMLMAKYPSAVLVATNCIDTDECGHPLESAYFLPAEFFTGGEMIRREIRGLGGIGGNSSFMIRREAYERVGGYDATFHYLADHLLGLKLCRVGDFAYTPRPLFYGRRHGRQSSVLDPREFSDLVDSYRIPSEILGKARPLTSTWWQIRIMNGRTGANHALNALHQIIGGDRRWGTRALFKAISMAESRWPIILMFPLIVLRRVRRKAQLTDHVTHGQNALSVVRPRTMTARD